MSFSIERWQERIHSNAVEKGFWALHPDRQALGMLSEKIALIHCEVSEAFEEIRKEELKIYYVKDKNGQDKPEGFPIEMADTVIRILDLCAGMGIELEHAMILKHDYNLTRPHMHGKKC